MNFLNCHTNLRVSNVSVIQVTRETHETPGSLQPRVTRAGRANRYSELNFRVVWGGSRVTRIGGRSLDVAGVPWLARDLSLVPHMPWMRSRAHGNPPPPFGCVMTSSVICGIARDVFSESPLESTAFPVAVIVVVPTGVAGPVMLPFP
jgi:hypothetical protein